MLQKLRRSSVGVTFVLTENKVQEEGYLASLEFVVAEPGPIRIQVGFLDVTSFPRNVHEDTLCLIL